MVQSQSASEQIPSASTHIMNFDENISWIQDGIQIAGGKRWGTDLEHLNFPFWYICYNDNQMIYIADYSNNRILEWKIGESSGRIVADYIENDERLCHPVDVIYDQITDSFIISDEGNNRIVRWPRQQNSDIEILVSNIDPWGIAVDNQGYLYVCDHKRHEVKRWKIGEPIGTIVAGGNGKGARLDQLSHPTCIFVDQDQSIYISDWGNHRIVKWEKDAEKGRLIAGGQDQGFGPLTLADPFGLYVDQSGNVFVADWGKHRIVRYRKDSTVAEIIVGHGGNGNGTNQFCHPMCLTFDRQGNLYVSDYSNNRIQKFNIQSNINDHTE